MTPLIPLLFVAGGVVGIALYVAWRIGRDTRISEEDYRRWLAEEYAKHNWMVRFEGGEASWEQTSVSTAATADTQVTTFQ